MADEHGLLRPLGSDSLKPRPSAQAVWEPAAPVEPFASEAEAPSSEGDLFSEDSLSDPASSQPDEEESLFPFTEDGEDDFSPFSIPAQAVSAPSAIRKKETSSARDAIPTEQMPVPVCVPLYEPAFSPRKRRVWPWLLVSVMMLGAAYIVWRCGILPLNWA